MSKDGWLGDSHKIVSGKYEMLRFRVARQNFDLVSMYLAGFERVRTLAPQFLVPHVLEQGLPSCDYISMTIKDNCAVAGCTISYIDSEFPWFNIGGVWALPEVRGFDVAAALMSYATVIDNRMSGHVSGATAMVRVTSDNKCNEASRRLLRKLRFREIEYLRVSGDQLPFDKALTETAESDGSIRGIKMVSNPWDLDEAAREVLGKFLVRNIEL